MFKSMKYLRKIHYFPRMGFKNDVSLGLRWNLQDFYKSGPVLKLSAMKAETCIWPSDDICKGKDIGLKYSETFSDPKCKWRFSLYCEPDPRDQEPRNLVVPSDDVFSKGYEVLEKYINNKPLNKQEQTALSALERFYSERAKHEASLRLLKDERNLTETEAASLLTNHFLAQLLPIQTNYCLDKFPKGKTDDCPCGCCTPLQFGLTSFGCPKLFYGSADIALFPSEKDVFAPVNGSNTAVFTFKKKKVALEEHDHDVTQDESLRDNEIEDEEFTAGELKEDNLEDGQAMRQLYKQAISLSICKQKEMIDVGEKELSLDKTKHSCIIPICGIAPNSYDIVLYDAKNDYLLSTTQSYRLFDGDRLLFHSIINIWLVLYHSLFSLGSDHHVLEHLRGTCGLREQLGKEKCQDIVEQSQWIYRIEMLGKRDKREVPKAKRILKDPARNRTFMEKLPPSDYRQSEVMVT